MSNEAVTTNLVLRPGPIRLVMTGDLHLGRSSSRVPAAVPTEELRATAAWRRIVDLALTESASIVCLSGDIADQDNKFWEAIGPLEQGIARLADAGIPTVAVSGNHDHEVMVRLADRLSPEHFHLLGRNGAWERIALTQDGAVAMHIDGWSFPTKHVRKDPVADYSFTRAGATPTLGMVHGDLYASTSAYAPLDLATMQSRDLDGWLIGHLHAPRMHDGRAWVFYPGSPQAFDPGEVQQHGPWLADVVDGQLGKPVQRPLSSVWYDRLSIDLSGVEDRSAYDARVLDSVRAHAESVVERAGASCLYVSLRLLLTGETSISSDVRSYAEEMQADMRLSVDGVMVGVDKIEVETLPVIDLEEYAGQRSAPGAVARLLLELDVAEPAADVLDLIRTTRRELDTRAKERVFLDLGQTEVSDEVARAHLRTQGRAFLTRLVQS